MAILAVNRLFKLRRLTLVLGLLVTLGFTIRAILSEAPSVRQRYKSDAVFRYPNTGAEKLGASPMDPPPAPRNVVLSPPPPPPPQRAKYDPSIVVRGRPTKKFADNLRSDIQYVTGWPSGGYTNDVMNYINLIWLAQLTGRVPIIPPIPPSHVAQKFGSIPFGDVFDLPRARQLLDMHIIDWRDVKDSSSDEVEELGCWSTWAKIGGDPVNTPRWNNVVKNLSLDVSYTPVPSNFKLTPENEKWDVHINAWKIAQLSWPDRGVMTQHDTDPPLASPLGARLHPDTHLLCFDFLYYMSVIRPFEWGEQYSPQWAVGTHVHFSPRMYDIANGYLRRLFGVPEGGEIPPFISMHVRRGDFKTYCTEVPMEECQAPLSAYARRVEEVQAELLHKFRLASVPVFLMSDESDPAWWAEVKALGWLAVDHGPDGEDTVGKYGGWYPPLLDSVFQSMGTGFVGTDRSTMSQLAMRRVQDWQGGAARIVNWGKLGADDH